MGIGGQRHVPANSPPTNHCRGGWVGLRAGPDVFGLSCTRIQSPDRPV